MDKFKQIKKASIWGIVGNLFLLIIKTIVGLISHSQAMIADAFNSASDIFSSIMTFVGNRIASKPRDDDHDLGHGKAEYIYSLFISLVMIMLSCKVFGNSLIALIDKSKFVFSYWLVIVCIVTIIVKWILFIYTDRLAKKYRNLLLEANSKDHRNDCLITLGNLIACLCSLINVYFVDGIIGMVISTWIFISGCKILKESYDVLMDKSIDKATKDKVYRIIRRHKEILKTNHFNATPVGYQYQISITIFVDGELSTFESHDIADRIEKEIVAEIAEIYLAVIHVNPMECKK